MQISPVADMLDTSQVEFRQSKSEWRVAGTATVVTGNTVKIHLGNDLTGPLLTGRRQPGGRARSLELPDRQRPAPPASLTISLECASGGVKLAIPIVVRN